MRLGRGGDSDGIFFPVLGFALCIVFYLHLNLRGSQGVSFQPNTEKEKEEKQDYACMSQDWS